MRKIIEFDPESYDALVLLARDRMSSLQELADEAFRDVLVKHGRPTSLKDALRRSLKKTPPKRGANRPGRRGEARPS
ncbi:MAG: ribbon-helix-helix domain-containing protein [Rhodospirillaceae bacterium]